MNLQESFPDIAKEWHLTKNANLKPCDVSCGSGKKVWWICNKAECGCIHEYEQSVNHKTSRNSGCPYCTNQKMDYHKSLEYLFPELAKEWHPTKNCNLKPCDVSCGSEKKIWWICNKAECGCIHEYEQSIYDKKIGNYCPYCSKNVSNKIDYHKSLEYLYPDIAKEWHPTKNYNLKPCDVSYGSGKKVWWICNKAECGCIHEYEQSICDKAKKKFGCPYCSNRTSKVDYHKSFEYLFPELSKEWHPTKNANLKPIDVACYSNKKVWWICTKANCGCIHEYEQVICSKTKDHDCSYCTNRKIDYHKSLEYIFPDIAKQFHPTKNNDLKPSNITSSGSDKKCWWICEKNHEYEQKVNSKKKGSGCPKCDSSKQFSKISMLWLNYIACKTNQYIQHALSDEGEYRIPETNYKADGYCKETNTIYEFHGDYWHGNPKKFEFDVMNLTVNLTFGELYEKTQQKKDMLIKLGYNYIDVWESDWKKAIKTIIKIQRLFRKNKLNKKYFI